MKVRRLYKCSRCFDGQERYRAIDNRGRYAHLCVSCYEGMAKAGKLRVGDYVPVEQTTLAIAMERAGI